MKTFFAYVGVFATWVFLTYVAGLIRHELEVRAQIRANKELVEFLNEIEVRRARARFN